MSRKSIMVNEEIKNKVKVLKEDLNLNTDQEVLEFLLRVNDSFDMVELQAFLSLRERMYGTFKREHKIK